MDVSCGCVRREMTEHAISSSRAPQRISWKTVDLTTLLVSALSTECRADVSERKGPENRIVTGVLFYEQITDNIYFDTVVEDIRWITHVTVCEESSNSVADNNKIERRACNEFGQKVGGGEKIIRLFDLWKAARKRYNKEKNPALSKIVQITLANLNHLLINPWERK